MKEWKSEAENANIKINQILNGENEQDTIDVDPLINNNNVALVLNDQENENK